MHINPDAEIQAKAIIAAAVIKAFGDQIRITEHCNFVEAVRQKTDAIYDAISP